MASRIVVVGGGFAGLWAAAAAARLRALRAAEDVLEIVLVAPDPFHVIRVRCYEDDLSCMRLPLDDVLGPIGVARQEARVASIDAAGRSLLLAKTEDAAERLTYDRLVLAPGSVLSRPGCPGAEHAFDVDDYAGAARLSAHLVGLAQAPEEGRWTVAILGAGLVGIELACEMPGRLAALRAASPRPSAEPPVRVLLLDHATEIGASMGAAKSAIGHALAAASVELRPCTVVRAVTASGLVLSDDTTIPAATVIAATGMRANPLAGSLPVACDPVGRLAVDAFLEVEGVAGVYAAGDVARAWAAEGHPTVMSCQHARPMGRVAGHNAACDLLGCPQERVAFAAPDYVTVLDLGPWGAVYTSGWNRATLVAEGAAAKETKRTINRHRIYPPTDGDRAAIMAAAAPAIQLRPTVRA